MEARETHVDSLNQKRPGGLNKFDKPHKVMVVDDSVTMRKIGGQQLKAEAYEICGEVARW